MTVQALSICDEGGITMSLVLSADSLTRRAYTGNTMYQNAGYRSDQKGNDMLRADQRAMLRAIDRLDTLDFSSSDETDTKRIYETITSYVEVYNNAVSSTTNADNSHINGIGKKLRALTKDYKSQLSDIGISIKSDGTLNVDATELKKATTIKVSKVFGDDAYKKDMRTIMKKLRSQLNRYPSYEATQYETSQTASEDTRNSAAYSSPETAGSSLNLYV